MQDYGWVGYIYREYYILVDENNCNKIFSLKYLRTNWQGNVTAS